MLGIVLVFFTLGIAIMRERTEPAYNRAAYEACVDNMRYLGRALESYRNDYGVFPPDLNALDPQYISSRRRLHCPLETRRIGAPYHYFPRGTHPTDPLVTCLNHGQGPLALHRNCKVALPERGLLHRPPRKENAR